MISNYVYKVTPSDKINDLIQDLKSGDPKLEPNTLIGTQIPNETTTGEHQLLNLTYEYLLNKDESLFDKIISVYDQVFLYDYVLDKEDHGDKEIYRLLLAVSLKLLLLRSEDFKEFCENLKKFTGSNNDSYYYGIRDSRETFNILTRTSPILEGGEGIGDFSKDIAVISKFFYSRNRIDDHKTVELADMTCIKSNSQYAECNLFRILYDKLYNFHGSRYNGPLSVLEEVALSEILGIPDSLTEGYYEVPGQVIMYLSLRITRDQRLTDLSNCSMNHLQESIASIRSCVDDLSREVPREVRDSMYLLD